MKDYLVRIMARDVNIRGVACVTTNLVDEARKRHGTSPTASAALGRALTGGALLGSLLKKEQRVALRFEGNGPLRKILVEADSRGAVRGYVGAPDADLPPRNGKLDVSGVLGRKGLLVVTKDLRMKEPYSGMVELRSGEIAEDLAHYLAESEQIPSAVALGVYVEPDKSVTAAGGFMVQSFPPRNEEMVEEMIRQIGKIPPVTDLLRRGKSPEQVLEQIFQGMPFDFLLQHDLSFECGCSKERVERALITLGRDEIATILENLGQADVRCEFCLQSYHLSGRELRGLLDEAAAKVVLH
ncbi:MAG: Hsp33 family molecular chaperone HslO [Desulfobacterales bacterium]|nr:Hsp33 family molecular chaperone HslO [Desulfobacterales bacterium]